MKPRACSDWKVYHGLSIKAKEGKDTTELTKDIKIVIDFYKTLRLTT